LLFKMLNRVMRYLFKKCFMFGPAEPWKAIRVRIHGRAKSRGAPAVEELATLDNFIFTFESQVDKVESELEREEISLYGFTPTLAIFSSVAPGSNVWGGTFSSVDQFNMADRLVLVPLDHFLTIMDRRRKAFEGKEVTFLFHSGRCGSTLVAAMFKRLPDTRVLCEPHAFYSAYYLHHVFRAISQTEFRKMLLAAVTALSQGTDQKVFIKMVQPCISQLGHLADLLPNAKFAFISRQQAAVVASYMRIVSQALPPAATRLGWTRQHFVRNGAWSRGEEKFPANIKEVFSVLWEDTLECVASADANVHKMTYEQLVDNPVQTVSGLVSFLGRSQEHVTNMVAVMEKDSQAGTIIAQGKLSK